MIFKGPGHESDTLVVHTCKLCGTEFGTVVPHDVVEAFKRGNLVDMDMPMGCGSPECNAVIYLGHHLRETLVRGGTQFVVHRTGGEWSDTKQGDTPCPK